MILRNNPFHPFSIACKGCIRMVGIPKVPQYILTVSSKNVAELRQTVGPIQFTQTVKQS